MTDQERSTNLRDAGRILFRHKKKVLAFFVTVVTLVTLVTLLTPKVYRSQGKLLVKLGRENVGIDPTVTLGQSNTVSPPLSREDEINSLVEILRSRAVIEGVVKTLTPEKILKHETSTSSRSPHERAVLLLQDDLGIGSARNSNVLDVTFDHEDREFSRLVVDTVMDVFIREHVRLNRTPKSQTFLDEQMKATRDKLLQAEDKLRQFENNAGLISPEIRERLLVEQIATLKADLQRVKTQQVAVQAEIEQLQSLFERGPDQSLAAASQGIANDALDDSRKQLYKLQAREKQLLTVYDADYVLVRQVRDQIRQTTELLENETKKQRTNLWPQRTYEEAQIALTTKRPLLASLQVQSTEMTKQLAQLQAEQKTIHDRSADIKQQRRQVALLEQSYRKYTEGLEQARVDQALQDEQISNLSIVQPALTQIKHVKPRTLINLVLGLLFGFVGGIALAVAAEYLDHSLKTNDDVEKHLGLPVLTSVPELKHPERDSRRIAW
ncbi:GumC family protein [Thalassoroseus pseudoceratinae]|uniref:GumC family protein n=1 Tax=Thalassoroseus pseudoceratinae TaxID=2713176 RepID=UPI00141F53AC|nr:hypothetical protein [Thalassoroseus pseudoceratinae]